MLGDSVLKHPDKLLIDEMFGNGHTAQEVSNKLKQIQKKKSLQVSAVSLQYYRKNFLNMSRSEIHQKRREMEALANNRDSNALTTFAASQDFIESKNKQSEEIQVAISEFRNIKDEVTSAIKLIKEQTVDAEGKPVFVPRHYEVMEKLLGRFESVNNSFIKASQEMTKQTVDNKYGSTNISIGQIEQNIEALKGAVKRVLLEIDPTKISRFFEIYSEETAKIAEQSGSEINIKINTAGSGETNINIITQLPTAEEAKQQLKDMTNENILEQVIDINPNEQN